MGQWENRIIVPGGTYATVLDCLFCLLRVAWNNTTITVACFLLQFVQKKHFAVSSAVCSLR